MVSSQVIIVLMIILYIPASRYTKTGLGKPQKESSFFSAPATKALPPKPRRT